MNIFYLDKNPEKIPEMMVDKHIGGKMVVETAQMLSTAHRVLDGELIISKNERGRKVKRWILPDQRETSLYLASHINHPSSVWARQSNNNYTWLYCHLVALCREYTYRYDKIHLTERLPIFQELKNLPRNIPVNYLMPIPSAMADEYKVSNDPLINYRYYYTFGKSHLHSWKRRNPPEWLTEALNRKEYNEFAIA